MRRRWPMVAIVFVLIAFALLNWSAEKITSAPIADVPPPALAPPPVAISASVPTSAATAQPAPANLLSLFYGFCPRPGEEPAQLSREARGALHKAWHLQDDFDLAGASRVLADYLKDAPDDTFIARARLRVETERDIEREDKERAQDGITVHFPSALAEDDAAWVASEVSKALDDAAALTHTERRARLQVVVATDRSELLATTCMPIWTAGVYDGVLRLVMQRNAKGPVSLRTLRHEALHAQLDSRVRRIPSWFNEGLAQYFSDERIPQHRAQLQLLVDNGTYIPFASLDDSFNAFDTAPDAGLAYFQSEAMIELLVARIGPQAIADAVRYLEDGGKPNALWATLAPALDEHDLLAFVARAMHP